MNPRRDSYRRGFRLLTKCGVQRIIPSKLPKQAFNSLNGCAICTPHRAGSLEILMYF